MDLRVLTLAGGKGNDLWTQEHARRVFEEATSQAHGDVRFVLSTYRLIENPALYEANSQPRILDELGDQEARPGRVTVFVSAPRGPSNAGWARVVSGTKEFRPRLVMRSRKNTGSDADLYETAAIFLHEMGHTLGFSHDGTSRAMPYNADGWWELPPARDLMQNLAGWMALHARGADPKAKDHFKCKVGGKVPGTHQLFDPPTDAPTEAECATRCLLAPGCVAFAQPTWENARCFLFGEGAQVTTDPGWNNVDTCWRK